MNLWKIVRAILGIAIVLVLLTVVYNYYGDYKLAASTPRPAATNPASGSTTTTATIGTGTVKTANVNFRVKPNSTAKLIRVLKQGEKLGIISKEAQWYQVKDAKGVVGWVTANTDYIGFQAK